VKLMCQEMTQRRQRFVMHPRNMAAAALTMLLQVSCWSALATAFVSSPVPQTCKHIHGETSIVALYDSLLQDKGKAYPQQTPHSGRHFMPTHPAYSRQLTKRRRFTEGWYYRLTIPDEEVSFAFIISIEDPGIPSSDIKLACIQVIGPNNEYLVQANHDDTRFWAWKHQQALGYTFEYHTNDVDVTTTAMDPDQWRRTVKSGFQVLPTRLQGKIDGHDGTKGGVLSEQGVSGECDFDFTFTPLVGWGDANKSQKSTAGWLASFSVFEPHWQVTLADARATGSVTWKNTTYEFNEVPFYAEKNWGAALPTKWYWTQCNSFHGYCDNEEPQLSRHGRRWCATNTSWKRVIGNDLYSLRRSVL